MINPPLLPDCTADSICEAAVALAAGHLVAFPTETVYGLGADARNPSAVKRIYEVKGRPSDHPLIVHISSINQLEKWATEIPEYANSLARSFWPGPMTLILKRTEIVGDFITGGQDTVGLRVPSDPIALALIHEFEHISGSAIAAPSANRFGQVSPTSSSDVYDELGEHLSDTDLVLNGGRSTIGIESTIIDCTGLSPIILRNGEISKDEIQTKLGIHVSDKSTESNARYSGSFEKHYAPKCRVVLEKHEAIGEAFFALAEIKTPFGMVRLGSPMSATEFARTLYATLRLADNNGFSILVISAPEGEGISIAIRERLSKAARGR